MTRAKCVILRKAAIDPIVRGHPWIWGGAIVSSDAKAAGEEVQLLSQESKKVIGRGIFDPDSPIAVRVWTLDDVAIDEELFVARLRHAIVRRRDLFSDAETTAYRLVNGDGDRMPGLVVDRYADIAIVRADGSAAEAVVRRFSTALTDTLRSDDVRAVALRISPRGGELRLESLAGDPPDGGSGGTDAAVGRESGGTVGGGDSATPSLAQASSWMGSNVDVDLPFADVTRLMSGFNRIRIRIGGVDVEESPEDAASPRGSPELFPPLEDPQPTPTIPPRIRRKALFERVDSVGTGSSSEEGVWCGSSNLRAAIERANYATIQG